MLHHRPRRVTRTPRDKRPGLRSALANLTLSRPFGRTLRRWRQEILNHHLTGPSNGSTEGLNLVIKKVKRAGHGFPTIRPLPAPLPPPRRRYHMAQPAITTPHPNPPIPTQMRRAAFECRLFGGEMPSNSGGGLHRVTFGSDHRDRLEPSFWGID